MADYLASGWEKGRRPMGMKKNTKTNTKPKQNRAEAERWLIDAALDLIQRNGARDGIAPAALADLGDGDNHHQLCLDSAVWRQN